MLRQRQYGSQLCPNCGRRLSNVQGIAACPDCEWISSRSRTRQQ